MVMGGHDAMSQPRLGEPGVTVKHFKIPPFTRWEKQKDGGEEKMHEK
jgi:hypothetical protein